MGLSFSNYVYFLCNSAPNAKLGRFQLFLDIEVSDQHCVTHCVMPIFSERLLSLAVCSYNSVVHCCQAIVLAYLMSVYVLILTSRTVDFGRFQ